MKLRTQLSAVVGLVTSLGVGVTGGMLVYRSHRHATESLIARQQLVAEGYAHTINSNLEFLAAELRRLEGMEEIDFNDNDNGPEKRLLHDARSSSGFFNHGVVLLAADGNCVWSEPPPMQSSQCAAGQSFWFERVRKTLDLVSWMELGGGPEGGPILGMVVPVVRDGVFVGALEGLIAVGDDAVFTPVLRRAASMGAEIVLVDRDADSVVESLPPVTTAMPGWHEAWEEIAVRGEMGTYRGPSPGGVDSLYAFAPIGRFGFEVICRWSWKALDTVLSRELVMLLAILGAGVLLSLAVGLATAQGLSRPLRALSNSADVLAGGDFANARLPAETGAAEEIGVLARAFHRMASSLGERDARIRDDLEEIRRIAAEKERLYKEVQDLAASLEMRVEERTRELRDAQGQLVSVERFAAMGKTAAVLAHEVKNALNGIGGLVDLILTDVGPTSRAQRLRGQLGAEITRLADLTESLLAFSRAPRIVRAPEDLNALVKRSIDMLREPLHDADADLDLLLDGDGAPLVVPCDGHKVQGAVMNLLKNAIEAVAAKPVLDLSSEQEADLVRGRLRVETRRVEGAAGDEVLIEIADSGGGLPAEVRAHLFEPFFTTKPSGTGLGLATARRYLEAHGGRVEVDPGPGPVLSGACVRLYLPLAELAGGEEAPGAAAGATKPALANAAS